MSAVELYWQERLQGRHPLANELLRVEGFNVRSWSGKDGQWPRAVARAALYEDYVEWYAAFALRLAETEWYVTNNVKPPPAATEFGFFTVMAPWLYVDGKDWHVKNYTVKQSVRHNQEWVTVHVRKYFVRLLDVEKHIDYFERAVGRSIVVAGERYVAT